VLLDVLGDLAILAALVLVGIGIYRKTRDRL
jgi:hypothetical protein